MLCALGILLAAPVGLIASTFKAEGDLEISNLHVIEDDLYVFGDDLTVDGTINGDLIAFGNKSRINGLIDGSISLFSQHVRYTGRTTGSIRIFAAEAEIEGPVERSAIIFAGKTKVSRRAVIERDLHIFSEDILVAGRIRGKTVIHGDKVEITGELDGDVEVDADSLTIGPATRISGSLTYESSDSTHLVVAPGAQIAGETKWVDSREDESEESAGHLAADAAKSAAALLAAFIFGLIVARLFRPYTEESLRQFTRRTSMSIAAGVLGLFLFVIAAVGFLISLIVMGIGYISLSSNAAAIGTVLLVLSTLFVPITSFAAVSGGVIFYSGKILISFWLGRLVLNRLRPGTGLISGSSLFVGLLILTILFMIPYVGLIAYLAAAIIGGGAIMLGIRFCRKESRSEEPSAAEPPAQPDPPAPEPPPTL